MMSFSPFTAPPLRPSVGSVIANRYRVDALLGEGGMAIVVGAIDEETSERVAVKLLQLTGTGSSERFIREARVAWTLSSDHVPRFLDAGSANGQLFIVMERLDGTDYGRRVRDVGPLEVVEVADCIVQACEALAHAHARGVVHRDIKASNLFLHAAPGGSIVKVLDFGVSKILADSAQASGAAEHTLTTSRDGGVLGSPPYMSPEQVRDPRKVDPRTDLWSLGVVAHRLLSAGLPFPGTTTGEVLASILERSAPPLSSIGIHVPSRIEQAILRCLARSRDDRYANVAELAAAFAPFVSPRWQHLPRTIADLLSVAPAHVVAPEVVTSTMTEPPGPGPGPRRALAPAPAPSTRPAPSAAPAVAVAPPRPPPRRLVRLQMVALGAIASVVLVLGIKATTQRGSAAASEPTFSPLPPPMPELDPAPTTTAAPTAPTAPGSAILAPLGAATATAPATAPFPGTAASAPSAPPPPPSAPRAVPRRTPKPGPAAPRHPAETGSALHPNPYGPNAP